MENNTDIEISQKRKINIFDKIIQSIIISVNIRKMNKSIDEHLSVIHKTEKEEQKEYQINILREIVFAKYLYEIIQKDMYELRLPYLPEITENINSSDKIKRLELQKTFLEMEYDRVTKTRFKSKDDLRYSLLILANTIELVKQNIKDEGKNNRYNDIIKLSLEIDTKLQTNEYTEDMYKEMFLLIDGYVDYINDNYDIAKLPTDERELIEYVIETTLAGIQSDLDKHMYEFRILVNICKNSFRYFKLIDKVFEKLVFIYNETLNSKVIEVKDYIKMYTEIYDMKIKTMVNDVHRTIKTEDEYLSFSRIYASGNEKDLNKFILETAILNVADKKVIKLLNEELENLNSEIEDVIQDTVTEEIIMPQEEDSNENNEESESQIAIKKTSLKDRLLNINN